MKLKQLYTEFVKLYMSKNERIIKADFKEENEKFDKGFGLKIYSYDVEDYYRNVCQVYEGDELRGLILGVRVNEGAQG